MQKCQKSIKKAFKKKLPHHKVKEIQKSKKSIPTHVKIKFRFPLKLNTTEASLFTVSNINI